MLVDGREKGERELLLSPLIAVGEETMLSPEKTMGCYVCDRGMVADRAIILPPLLIFCFPVSVFVYLFAILLLTRWSFPSHKFFP